MILVAIILFGLAVAFGLLLVFIGMRYRRGSLLLVVGHVGAALAGLGFLGWQISNGPSYKFYNISALLFFMALFGGLVLLALRISKREYRTAPPMFAVSLHALMAIFALILLVVGFMKV